MNKKKTSELKKHIGFWMRIVSNNVSHSFAKRLEASNVTVAEWVVLREMHESNDVIAPSTIAELTGLTRGAISKLVDKLIEKKLVTRKEATDDRRYQEIELTAKGIDLIPHLASLADQNDDAFFSVLTKTEQKELKDLLIKVTQKNGLNKFPVT